VRRPFVLIRYEQSRGLAGGTWSQVQTHDEEQAQHERDQRGVAGAVVHNGHSEPEQEKEQGHSHAGGHCVMEPGFVLRRRMTLFGGHGTLWCGHDGKRLTRSRFQEGNNLAGD
jgi:hypothetical protein